MRYYVYIIIFLLTTASCCERGSGFYVKDNCIYSCLDNQCVKRFDFQTYSYVIRGDSLIINEFYPFPKEDINNDNCFFRSWLYEKECNRIVEYDNISPFRSFFNGEADLFANITIRSLNGDSILYDKIISYDICVLFRNLLEPYYNYYNEPDVDNIINEQDSLGIDSLIREGLVSFDNSSRVSVIDSIKKHPSCMKSHGFFNYITIDIYDNQGDTLTVTDYSLELPTGVVWVMRKEDNYLRLYDYKCEIFDWVRNSIDSTCEVYSYLNKTWTMILQYETLHQDVNVRDFYWLE